MIHLAIKFVCLLGLLSGTSLLTQAQPQYVEPAIKIGVFDSGGNPIDKPKVIVYDYDFNLKKIIDMGMPILRIETKGNSNTIYAVGIDLYFCIVTYEI